MGVTMLDVHVLFMDYTDRAIQEQCKASIECAVKNAPFEIKVHYLPGIYGHLGRARHRGYSIGHAPYVTHVDDDDYVSPDVFCRLLPMMQRDVTAITTGESLIINEKIVEQRPDCRHHLAVFRRDVVATQPYAVFRMLPDQFLLRQIPSVHIAECLYFHRIDPDSGSRRLRRDNPQEERREITLLSRPDLLQIEGMTREQITAMYDELFSEQYIR